MDLYGIHPVKGDKKGRVQVPKQFRDQFDESGIQQFMITTNLSGRHRHIEVVFPDEWQRIVTWLATQPQMDPAIVKFRKVHITPALPVPLDSVGRILVPPYHRDWAKIDGEVLVTGGTDRFLIWDKDQYNDSIADIEPDDYESVLRQISERMRG
jgi:transcriptional regulator MraZ